MCRVLEVQASDVNCSSKCGLRPLTLVDSLRAPDPRLNRRQTFKRKITHQFEDQPLEPVKVLTATLFECPGPCLLGRVDFALLNTSEHVLQPFCVTEVLRILSRLFLWELYYDRVSD